MSDLNLILLKILEIQNKTVLKLIGIGVYLLPDNVTLAGNEFNGILQLVKTNSNRLIPSDLYDIEYIITKIKLAGINIEGSDNTDNSTL